MKLCTIDSNHLPPPNQSCTLFASETAIGSDFVVSGFQIAGQILSSSCTKLRYQLLVKIVSESFENLCRDQNSITRDGNNEINR